MTVNVENVEKLASNSFLWVYIIKASRVTQCCVENVDISDIFVNFVFQSGRDYQLSTGHISFLICNYK